MLKGMLRLMLRPMIDPSDLEQLTFNGEGLTFNSEDLTT